MFLWRLQQKVWHKSYDFSFPGQVSAAISITTSQISNLISISLHPPTSWHHCFVPFKLPSLPNHWTASPWPSEVPCCSWRRLFTSTNRLNSTETSRWSPCASRWTGPASVLKRMASSGPELHCASPTATDEKAAVVPCWSLETFSSMETCTFATAVHLVVDPWAEIGATQAELCEALIITIMPRILTSNAEQYFPCYESEGFLKLFGRKPQHLLGRRSHLRREDLHPVRWNVDNRQLIGGGRRRGVPWSTSWGSFEMLLKLALSLW